MQTILSLTKRNILMFVKDKAAVFFSLLSVLIIIGLYALFLADINIKTVQRLINIDRQTIAYLINSWVMAGIIIVNSVTVTLGVIGIMVDDEAENRIYAFLVAPVSRLKLVLGYVLSAFIVGNVLCVLTFIVSQIYILAAGGTLLTFFQVLKVLGVILVSVFSSTCFVFFLVSFIRSRNAFSTISTIVGTLIGFVAGIYLPIGELPNAVQKFIKCVPVFYSTSLMRDVFMVNPVSIAFKGAPENVVSNYLELMGVKIYWGGTMVSDLNEIEIMIISGAVFLILSVIVMRKRRMARI